MRKTRLKAALICAAFGIALIFFARIGHASAIREVKSGARSLITIQTALGFSTILEFPSKPLSAVLGDQDGFKLEYVGTSITLKPLIHGARSNLFVFTDSGRYNFSIQSGAPTNVDYIVTIKSNDEFPKVVGSSAPTSPYRITEINKKTTSNGITLQVDRIKFSRDTGNPRAASLIEFEISSLEKAYAFRASSIGVKQEGKYLSAESIYLDQLSVSPRTPVHGVIAVLNDEWKKNTPVSLVFAISRPNPKTKKSKTLRLEVVIHTPSKPVVKKGVKNGEIELFPKVHP